MFSNVVIGLKSGLPEEPLLGLTTSVCADGATLHLLSLIQVGRDEDQHARLKYVDHELETIAAPLRERGFQVVCHSGIVPVNAGGYLARYVEDHEADLLVIGLSKRTRVGKALMGSDAQTALLSANCPVLSIHVNAG